MPNEPCANANQCANKARFDECRADLERVHAEHLENLIRLRDEAGAEWGRELEALKVEFDARPEVVRHRKEMAFLAQQSEREAAQMTERVKALREELDDVRAQVDDARRDLRIARRKRDEAVRATEVAERDAALYTSAIRENTGLRELFAELSQQKTPEAAVALVAVAAELRARREGER